MFLHGKGFYILHGLASAIGLPITFLFFDQIMLPQVANHAPLGFFEFAIGICSILAIALLMIGSQMFKVAKTNPAEILKTE